jgi:hypothetical protein
LKANQKKPLKVEDVKLLSDYLKTYWQKEVLNLLNSMRLNKPGEWWCRY